MDVADFVLGYAEQKPSLLRLADLSWKISLEFSFFDGHATVSNLHKELSVVGFLAKCNAFYFTFVFSNLNSTKD